MGLGDITLISSPLLQVLQRLEMSLTTLRDTELQELGDLVTQKCLEHPFLFEGLWHMLEDIASCVSEPIPLSQLPLQGHEKDEVFDIINSIYDNSVALSNISLQLETIGKLVRFASSEEMAQMGEMEMAGGLDKDPLLPVHTYHEIIQSKPGKEQVSSMDTNINEGSTSEVANTSEPCESFNNLPQHLKGCVIYTCILFLGDYEFEEDTIIQLWIAVGFIRTRQEQLAERGQIYFGELCKLSIFQMSPTVSENYEPTYRVHKDVYELIKQHCPNEYAIMEEGGSNNVSPVTLHSTLLLGDKIGNFDMKIFERFYEAELLRTLKLQNECGRPIKYISHNLFVKLRFLRVLDLSSTEIKELPTSVCNLRHLRYLDVSSTRIRKLPESMSKLDKLETLKLKDCSDLVGLPNEMSKLINLQYLDLNGVHQLTSMPPRMGQLTNLHMLNRFIVGIEEGFGIEELKYMKKLGGSLCIEKMENVTKDQANEAQLGDKDAIHKLEFQWSSSQSKGEKEFNLIEPHRSIKQLKITRYGAESFPNWLSSNNFHQLTVIHLRNCNCTQLPNLGKLPFLKSLYMHEMYSLKEINHAFHGHFEKLEVLEMDGMPCLEKWTAIKEYDMPSLRELTIIDCPKLVTLPELINLKSLQHLRVILCPEIQSFLGERLSESLQSLTITKCAKLEEQCLKREGEWSNLIASIPEIWIAYQRIP
ncbi:putative disease resistance RPP13-like protein 1 [Telopea speciosissima]|uniref:putative disease resistance RPP13-like protein 1 n=1 Tax=Telopea speciosissima TaxID=54955 RepID=UPI001CC52A64|nr:putative disease resistance RPP13-like protein 1 [Telopea speciosissima]